MDVNYIPVKISETKQKQPGPPTSLKRHLKILASCRPLAGAEDVVPSDPPNCREEEVEPEASLGQPPPQVSMSPPWDIEFVPLNNPSLQEESRNDVGRDAHRRVKFFFSPHPPQRSFLKVTVATQRLCGQGKCHLSLSLLTSPSAFPVPLPELSPSLYSHWASSNSSPS